MKLATISETTKWISKIILGGILMLSSQVLYSQDEIELGEDIYELSPFVIDSENDDGWVADTTLIGTRTRQSIKNLPISVDALTTEFMEDLGAYTLHDAGYFVAGLDSLDEHERDTDDGRTSFRGLDLGGRENSQSSRNFFLWYSRSDTYNSERIDFNKGSNSLMYGDASPGGLATVYTKRAMDNNFVELTAQYGSYDSYRLMLDVNRKLTDNLFLRFNTVDRNTRSYLDFASDHLKGYHFAATYKPFENTIIRAEYEKLDFDRSRANSGLEINQRAALGRGFSTTSRNYYTSDGDYVDSRARLVYESDGSGGFNTPYAIASNDRRNGATGDDLSLSVGMTQTVRDRTTGAPLLTVGPFPRNINTRGTRDFIVRPITNYSIWVEQNLGDLYMEFAYNRQEQVQKRNDNSFGTVLSVDSTGRLYADSDLDRKEYGNDVNILRFTAAYPLDLKFTKQFIVANLSYQDDYAYSFRERLVNRAKAFDPDTGEYDVTHDLEGRDRIRIRGYFDADNTVDDLENPNVFNNLLPENLPNIPGVFEPLWVHYTTSNRPFVDKRFTRTWSVSSSGEYFGGKLRSLLGIRWDGFKLKRYVLPGGTRAERVAEYGEIAWWGQDVFLGSPDDAPDQYAYQPDLDQSSTTYSAGLSYAITESINLYVNSSTSFRWQGTENFLGEVLGPQEGETIEIGVKGDVMDGLFTFGLAAFEVDRENVAFRFSTGNNAEELELLFNDLSIDIVDGVMTYTPAEPGSAGFLEIPRGLNNEHRQVTSSETSKGSELTLTMRRTKGLRARLALSHIEIEADRDMSLYAEQVRLAEIRAQERATLIDQHWANDPNFQEGTLPGIEEELREYLDDAQQVVASNTADRPVTGSRTRPWRVSWILDYQFDEDFFLPKLRVLLSGKWSDDYLLSTNDGVEWYGGSTHPVNLGFVYSTKLMDYPTTFRLQIRNLTELENDGKKERSGFVDQFTGDEIFRYRNVAPTSADFTMTIRF